MNTLYLTYKELVDMTGKVQHAAQARELEHLQIPFKRRTDGRVLVLRDDLKTRETSGPAERRPQLRLA